MTEFRQGVAIPSYDCHSVSQFRHTFFAGTDEIDDTRNMVVYTCPCTNRTSSILSKMLVDIFNANVTFCVKQFTASLVDETSVHFGFIVEND